MFFGVNIFRGSVKFDLSKPLNLLYLFSNLNNPYLIK